RDWRSESLLSHLRPRQRYPPASGFRREDPSHTSMRAARVFPGPFVRRQGRVVPIAAHRNLSKLPGRDERVRNGRRREVYYSDDRNVSTFLRSVEVSLLNASRAKAPWLPWRAIASSTLRLWLSCMNRPRARRSHSAVVLIL